MAAQFPNECLVNSLRPVEELREKRWRRFWDLEAEIQQDVSAVVSQSHFLNLKEIYTASDSPSFAPRSNHDVHGPHTARGMPNQATLNVNALRFRQSANCKHDYGGTVDAQSHCQLVQKFEDVPVESHADNGRGLHGPKFKASASKPQRRLNFSRSFLQSGKIWLQSCASLRKALRILNVRIT